MLTDHVVKAQISGCPVGLGKMKAVFYYNGPGLVGVAAGSAGFPAGTSQGGVYGPVPPVAIQWWSTAHRTTVPNVPAGEIELPVLHGYIDMTGPGGASTWQSGDMVNLAGGAVTMK